MQNKNKLELSNTLRELWEQHVMWTRSFIISTAAELGDLEYVTNRLLQNPVDMAKALEPFYGKDIADRLQQLLTEHLKIGGDLVTAYKNGSAGRAYELERKWFANADHIAAFLARINPYWSRSQWQNLLYDHLKMTKQEAIYRLNKKYADDIKMYDNIENEALRMADYMTHGIVQQFKVQ